MEQESTSKFGEMPENRSFMRVTITAETDREVRGTRKMGDFEMVDQVLVEKGWKEAVLGGEGSCSMCGKAHKKSDQEWSNEEVDVAGKKLRCDVLDQTTYDCKGEKQYVAKTWYSKDVPGWVAMSELAFFGSIIGANKTRTTGYEKK